MDSVHGHLLHHPTVCDDWTWRVRLDLGSCWWHHAWNPRAVVQSHESPV